MLISDWVIYKEKYIIDEALISVLCEEKPSFIGLQQNHNYTVFFKRKRGYLRLIFKVHKQNIEIVTFYVTDHVPTLL